MTQRYTNGSGREPEPDNNVASLDEARRRAAAKAKADKRAAQQAASGGSGTPRDKVIGGVLIVLALGMVAYWLAPLLRSIIGR